jgi:GH25 family lysozyme M1 (1,4-beta-N-acetylmuramidase)
VDRLEDKILTWLSIVAEKTGKNPLVYTSPSIINEIIKPTSTSLATFPLWLGWWRKTEPPAPAPWTTWQIWQMGDVYTKWGSRSGIMIERIVR